MFSLLYRGPKFNYGWNSHKCLSWIVAIIINYLNTISQFQQMLQWLSVRGQKWAVCFWFRRNLLINRTPTTVFITDPYRLHRTQYQEILLCIIGSIYLYRFKLLQSDPGEMEDYELSHSWFVLFTQLTVHMTGIGAITRKFFFGAIFHEFPGIRHFLTLNHNGIPWHSSWILKENLIT